MPKMICTQAIEYPPCHPRKPGDEFEVEEQHVNLLKVIGRAELSEASATTTDEAPRRRRRAAS